MTFENKKLFRKPRPPKLVKVNLSKLIDNYDLEDEEEVEVDNENYDKKENNLSFNDFDNILLNDALSDFTGSKSSSAISSNRQVLTPAAYFNDKQINNKNKFMVSLALPGSSSNLNMENQEKQEEKLINDINDDYISDIDQYYNINEIYNDDNMNKDKEYEEVIKLIFFSFYLKF